MTIHALSPYRIRVETDGEPLLGLATGVDSGSLAARTLARHSRRGGILIQHQRLTPWPVRRLVEYKGEIYLCIDFRDGWTVAEHLEQLKTPVPAALGEPLPKWITAVVDALAKSHQHEDIDVPHAGMALVGEDETVFALDALFARAIRDGVPYPARTTCMARFEHPGLAPTRSAAYRAAALLYRAFTGVPVCNPSDESTSRACHESPPTPIHAMRPEIDARCAESVEAALSNPADAQIGALAQWSSSEAIVELQTDEQKEARRAAVLREDQRRRRATSARALVRTNLSRAVIIAIGAILIGIIPYSMIRQARAIPETVGLQAEGVVARWFSAWTELDHQLMEQITADDAGNEIIREISNIFVIQRVQFAQTGESNILSAPEWLANGRPEGTIPYGVTDLSLRVVAASAERATVDATYTLWRPETGGEQTQASATRILEQIELRYDQRLGWQISDLTELESEQIDLVPLANPQAAPSERE